MDYNDDDLLAAAPRATPTPLDPDTYDPFGAGVRYPTPTRSPTPTRQATPTRQPTPTREPTPTRVPTNTPVPTPTRVPTQTPVPTPTREPTPTRTPTPEPTPTRSPTPWPTLGPVRPGTGPGARGARIPIPDEPPGMPRDRWEKIWTDLVADPETADAMEAQQNGDKLTDRQRQVLVEGSNLVRNEITRWQRGLPFEPVPGEKAYVDPSASPTAAATAEASAAPTGTATAASGATATDLPLATSTPYPTSGPHNPLAPTPGPTPPGVVLPRASETAEPYPSLGPLPGGTPEPFGTPPPGEPGGPPLPPPLPRQISGPDISAMDDTRATGAPPAPAPPPPYGREDFPSEYGGNTFAPAAVPLPDVTGEPAATAPPPPTRPATAPLPPFTGSTPDEQAGVARPQSPSLRTPPVAKNGPPDIGSPTRPGAVTTPPPPPPPPAPPPPPRPVSSTLDPFGTDQDTIGAGPLRSAIEAAGGRAGASTARDVARGQGPIVRGGYQGLDPSWRTDAAQAAAAWLEQYHRAPDTLDPRERAEYRRDPTALQRTILDPDSPFANYRESWIGAFRAGQLVPTAEAYDADLRRYGGDEYQSPYVGTSARRPDVAPEPAVLPDVSGVPARVGDTLGLGVGSLGPPTASVARPPDVAPYTPAADEPLPIYNDQRDMVPPDQGPSYADQGPSPEDLAPAPEDTGPPPEEEIPPDELPPPDDQTESDLEMPSLDGYD